MTAKQPATPDGSTPTSKGSTHSSIDNEPVPRLPHEHDQSSDQQAGPLDDNVVQASKDVKRGLVDTDRGDAMDETYKKQKKAPR